ncbi:MAG: serpin [Bacillota bacterium]|nr:serpin [Bacillota bacterium]
MKKMILWLVLLLMVTACSGCASPTAENLMKGVNGKDIASTLIGNQQQNITDKTTEIVDFSLDIFKKIHEDENTLISPLSIISALAMTANGAEKNTLSEMEEVFGADIGSLNEYLYAYQADLPTSDKYKVSLANSIWFKDTENLMIEKGFLQTNKDYYNAEVYKAPFDDGTKNDINAWVNKKTDGQIQELLSERPPENSVLYLINALSFDAEWKDIYQDTSISEGEFTNKAGNKKTVDFMDSTEYSYIELPNAIGFSKPYADDQYSFVALLPEEGLPVSDFINSLDGKMLMKALKKQSDEKVYASIPKFTFEYSKELSQILKELGIKDAFDVDLADFSSMGSSEGNLYINRVIHKTKIDVDEKGTKAGAVTAVEMLCGAVATQDEPKIVELNRPFFFMIVDNEFHMPIFMGVLNDVK